MILMPAVGPLKHGRNASFLARPCQSSPELPTSVSIRMVTTLRASRLRVSTGCQPEWPGMFEQELYQSEDGEIAKMPYLNVYSTYDNIA